MHVGGAGCCPPHGPAVVPGPCSGGVSPGAPTPCRERSGAAPTSWRRRSNRGASAGCADGTVNVAASTAADGGAGAGIIIRAPPFMGMASCTQPPLAPLPGAGGLHASLQAPLGQHTCAGGGGRCSPAAPQRRRRRLAGARCSCPAPAALFARVYRLWRVLFARARRRVQGWRARGLARVASGGRRIAVRGWSRGPARTHTGRLNALMTAGLSTWAEHMCTRRCAGILVSAPCGSMQVRGLISKWAAAAAAVAARGLVR